MSSSKTPDRTILAEKYITIHTHGKALTSGQRTVILTVFGNLLIENPNSTLRDLYERTAILTGTSRATVERIKKTVDEGKVLSTPGKKRPGGAGLQTRMKKCDDFTKIGIRRIVHNMYRENKPPTVAAVTEKINDDSSLPNMSIRTVHRYLKDLGFTYGRRVRKSVLLERPDLIVWRRKFLRSLRQFRREKRPIFYTDETFLNAGHTVNFAWQPSYVQSARQAFIDGETTGLNNIPGRGGRLIIAHIGNENGFVKNPENENEDARLIFTANKKKKNKVSETDYHTEMNGTCFEEWFRKVLPMLPPNSVIVMDNASYHSRCVEKFPTMKWKKIDIQSYLTTKNVQWTSSDVKAELISKAEPFRESSRKYIVDEMAAKLGHTVLRLPPYHCDLNPIELAWGYIKNNIARHNVSYTLGDVEKLLNNNLDQTSAELWQGFIEHTRKVEEEMWKIDDIADFFSDEQNQVIVTVGSDSESNFSFFNDTEDELLAEELPPDSWTG